MPVKLNKRGETYAQARINSGKIDYDSDWSLSDDERNAMFAEGIDRFSDWHLAKDTDEDEDRVSHYQFATGKGGRVYRSALEGIIKEARRRKKKDPGCSDVEAAAKTLIDNIDRKKANSRRYMFFGPREGMENEEDPRKRFSGVILLDTLVVLDDHPDMVEGGGPEGWTQIARTGKWLGHWQGPFEVSEDDIAVMKVNFDRFVLPMMFDYGHESVYDAAALASGWGHEFEIGKKGQALYSNTEWTRRAADHIRAGEYKYISPVILFNTTDPYSGEDIGPSIWTVALTNTPFLDAMDPVEIGGQIAAARRAFGGAPPHRKWAPRQAEMQFTTPAPAGTTETNTTPEPVPAEPAPEPEVKVNTTQPQKEDIVDRTKVCQELGIPEDSTDEQIFKALRDRPKADTKALTDAQAAQAQAEEERRVALAKAEALEKEKKERELKDAQDLVEAYIKAGRMAPASREKAVNMALADMASFETVYGKPDEPGRAVVPMGAVAPAEPASQMAGHSASALTDEDQAVIAKMRPRLERLAQKRSARLSKELGRPVTCTVEEMFAEEKDRRASKKILGKVFEHPPTKNTTRVG